MQDVKNNNRPAENFSILVSLHNDHPALHSSGWQSILDTLRNPQRNPNFYRNWASLCQLEENKALPPLQRCEGGLGGSINTEDKQCRIIVSSVIHPRYPGIGYIGEILSTDRHFRVRFENSSDGKDIWIFNQIIDLCQALEALLTQMMGKKCADCIIVYKCMNRHSEKEILEPTPSSLLKTPKPSLSSSITEWVGESRIFRAGRYKYPNGIWRTDFNQ